MEEQELVPFRATHPGKILGNELKARKIKQKYFAKRIEKAETMLNEIIKGKRPISADTALLLERELGIKAEFWMSMQSNYDLDIARIKAREEQIVIWEKIRTLIPVKFIEKSIPLPSLIDKKNAFVFNLFNVNNVASLEKIITENSYAFFRKSEKLKTNRVNLLSWSKVVEFQAKTLKIGKFFPENQEKIIKELNSVFYENNKVIEKVKEILSNNGIKLIVLEKFDQTPIDGYSFWSENNPVIGLSLRHNRIDNFAFTLLHELGHIFRHIIKNNEMYFVDIEEEPTLIEEMNKFEIEADNYAKNYLIPQSVWEDFQQNCFVDDDLIISFSQKYKIHPAILFGRNCFETNNYKKQTTIDRNIR